MRCAITVQMFSVTNSSTSGNSSYSKCKHRGSADKVLAVQVEGSEFNHHCTHSGQKQDFL